MPSGKEKYGGLFVVPTLLNSVRATQDKDLTLFLGGYMKNKRIQPLWEPLCLRLSPQNSGGLHSKKYA